MTTRTRSLAVAAALAVTVMVAGCGADDTASDSTSESAKPHGYVEGATEASEPQLSLAYTDRGGRRLRIIDPATEKSARIDLTVGADRLYEDGRFVYVVSGGKVEVVDSGGWTVDHVDHVHYYRAPSRSLGVVELAAPVASVAGSAAVTAVGSAGGKVTLLDRKALENGAVQQLTSIDTKSATGFAVPYDDGVVVAEGDDATKPASRLVYRDKAGAARGPVQACVDPRGFAELRNVVAVSCAEGIALFTRSGEKIGSQLLGYDAGRPRATELTFRPRSNYAAAATESGVWVLNSSSRTLQWVATGQRPLTAVAPGKAEPTVVILSPAGALTAVAVPGGRALAEADGGGDAGSTLTIDSSRAYLSAPKANAIYEVDYADALRRARSFPTETAPELMVEVGR